MAGNLGYFLGGMASGLKSGFNMGQMKWQQNEKKKLQKKQDEMLEASSVFNNMVAQLGEDGSYSDDDMMKINTSYMALGYDVKDKVDGTYKAIQAMDKKTIDANYQWFDLVLDSTNGMKSGDAQGIFDTIRPFVSGEKGLQMYEALESITKKKADIAPPPEIFTSAEAVRGKYPEAGVRYTDKGYVPTLGEPEAPPTEIDLMAENKKKLDYAYNTGNASYFNQTAKSMGVDTTFDTYGQKYEKPETDDGTKEPPPIPFKTLQTVKDSFKNVKTKAEYDEALQSYNASKEAKSSDWTPPTFEKQITSLIKKVESALWSDYVNKSGKLKNKAEAEEYNSHLQHYLMLIEEAKNAGIDVSQFQAFIPYETSGFLGMGNKPVTSESW